LIFTERFFEQSGLSKVIDEAIGARKGRGASDSEHIKALVISQTCGGDAIEHMNLSSRKIIACYVAKVLQSQRLCAEMG
jgi:hypothetical protein